MAPHGRAVSFHFTEPITITKKVSRSGGSLCVQVSKDLVEALQLDSSSLLEVTIRKVVNVAIQPSKFDDK